MKYIKKFFISKKYNIYYLYRDLVFQSENPKYNDIHELMKILLNKKVNMRVCKVSTLKGSNLFTGFDWNKLIDFSISPPYIPPEFPLDKSMLESRESFERKIVQDEQSSNAYKIEHLRDDYEDDYIESKWADNF